MRIERQNRRVITCEIREPELHQLVLKDVAEKAGVNLLSPNVQFRVYSSTYDNGSISTTSKPCVKVEIIEELDTDATPPAA